MAQDTGGLGTGVRRPWSDLPAELRSAAEGAAGSRVRRATTCVGGFSPGIAARLDLADGTRRFVKAVSTEPNPDSPTFYRQEITVNGWLDAAVPAPRLLWHHDDGEWVVLLFEHVDAATPSLPWRDDELGRCLDALASAHEALTPAPAGAPDAAELLGAEFEGWSLLAAGDGGGLDDWSRRHVERLALVEQDWAAACASDTLAHLDVRADNLLVDSTRAWIVDWPWAARASGWTDVVGMAPSVALQGGPPGEDLLARYAGPRPDDAQLAAFLAALAGFFTERSLAPEPPGLPTVRAYQAAQAEVARSWLARLLRLP
jgi:hypothetical protein